AATGVAAASLLVAPAEPRAEPDPVAQARALDEQLLFYPSRYPNGDWQPAGVDFEDVWFTSRDGTRLHGWYFANRDARAVVLYLHGNAGNVTHRARLIERLRTRLGLTVLVFDYRGYGRSAGEPTVPGVLEDARAARAFVARRAGVDESDVVLMGRSLGGAVAVELAAELEPRGLVLMSTFSSLKDLAAHHVPLLAWVVPSDKLDSLAGIRKYTGPLLQSHGDADRTVPLSFGRRLFEAAHEPKRFVLIPGARHNSPQPESYYVELDRFVESLPGR
ncbi:MAG: alpha/beta hydrolase, partial [Gammaproteobacteria bacterium]|nr:alpha/beta hydrolase [Gammaproteobacteria bacterium]